METLMKTIDGILKNNETTIYLLKWEVESLKKENAKLKDRIETIEANEGETV